MPDYLPTQEAKLLTWVANFLNVASDHLAALGLSAADLTPIQEDASDLTVGLADVAAAKASQEGAVLAKEAALGRTAHDCRALVRRIQNHAGVPDALKGQLGITVPSGTRTKTAPATPTDVLATPLASGVNTLAWNVAGNKATTQYAILAKTLTSGARVSDEADWAMVGLTTRSRFEHTGVTPGVPMAYRVMAARAGQSSLPSMPAVVYGG